MADQTSSPVQQARHVPYPTQIYLFSIAGGRCEFQGCNHYLLEHPLTLTKGNYAQEAHIVAFKENGPRGGTRVRPTDIHSVENLMLLCHECHTLIDKHPDQYTVATLKEYKRSHEERIKHVTGLGPDLKTSIVQLKALINNQPVAIPVAQVTEAVAPRYPSDTRGWVMDLTHISDIDPDYIQVACRKIQCDLDKIYAPGMDVESTRHISLFALAPIPLLVYLGSRLSNKIPVDLFQRHRDTEDWVWKQDGQPVEYVFRIVQTGTDRSCVALLLSISGRVQLETLPKEVDERFFVYEITVKDLVPDPTVFRTKQDLDNFKNIYQSSLRKMFQDHGAIPALHLFPAVPAPVAVLCGRELLPKVDPALYVYDNHKKKGGFTLALRINEL